MEFLMHNVFQRNVKKYEEYKLKLYIIHCIHNTNLLPIN